MCSLPTASCPWHVTMCRKMYIFSSVCINHLSIGFKCHPFKQSAALCCTICIQQQADMPHTPTLCINDCRFVVKCTHSHSRNSVIQNKSYSAIEYSLAGTHFKMRSKNSKAPSNFKRTCARFQEHMEKVLFPQRNGTVCSRLE